MRVFYSLWLAALLMVGGLEATAAAPAAAEAGAVSAQLEDGGRTLVVTTPGFAVFRGGFWASVERDGVGFVLDSSAGTVVGTQSHTAQASALGPVSGTTSVIRFEKELIELLFRMDRVLAAPQTVLVQTGIRNLGERPVRLVNVASLAMDERLPAAAAGGGGRFLEVSGKPEEWLLTGLHVVTPELHDLDARNGKVWLHEQSGFYRRDGVGVLVGPVGGPAAGLSSQFMPLGNAQAALSLVSGMDSVRVNPGATRWGQQAALFFEPPRTAMARWAEWLGKTHGARTTQGALSGWNSGAFQGNTITGKELLDITGAVVESAGHLRPEVIQIDQGYEAGNGVPLAANAKFPEGLPFYAQKIAATGARPGLLLPVELPSKPLPEVVAMVRQAVAAGFTYLKISYDIPNPPPGDDKTAFEAFRGCMQEIRQAAGENCYILFSGRVTHERVITGIVDAVSTGRPVQRENVKSVLDQVLRSYYLNGRLFAVDNDRYYMATELQDVSPVVGGWPLARTWISAVGLSCGAAFTSDMWQQERFKPYWRNVEVLTPPARERTEVLDLCTATEWPRLVGQVKREWGDFTVALLWNPSDKEQAVTLDFAQAGLDPQKRYAVWSFWDNRYLGIAEKEWTTPFLAPSASQHLRFTELPPGTERPVLIGSNLHIYCGAAETFRVTALESALLIELADAGARAGDLFVYSRQRPELRRTSGCTVTGIVAAGENAWKISLTDRRHGERQLIELGIPLPLTRQTWFWGLCGLLLCALAVGVWRHLAGIRHRRERALERERIRIARDIHDEVGSTLTWILRLAIEQPNPTIQGATRKVMQAMDEIVWAVNPKNDTLENMANYLVDYAGKFLRPTGIAWEADVPLILPARAVPADVRHNLFMALREALNNAVKHGEPQRIRFGLMFDGGWLTLTVQDDGHGFDPQAVGAAEADGLANMCQRLTVIGGECRVESAPGAGTTVTLRVRV